MSEDADIKLSFTDAFDDRAAYEAEVRGYMGRAAVEIAGQGKYPVCFYDPVRLKQDLEEEAKAGTAFIAEPGMIVIPIVTFEYMEAAVRNLFRQGYFQHLRSVDELG